jgi:membrane protease YdiL (CAAX protease family)
VTQGLPQLAFPATDALLWTSPRLSQLAENSLAGKAVLAAAMSVVLGVCLAALLVWTTRLLVRRTRWASTLHQDLQPVARRFDPQETWLVAIMSALGEELFFRGFLQPLVGLFASSLLFGLLHQVRGQSRWVWVGWASIGGLLFGGLFALTGSLWGSVVAHALVNAVNLDHLRRSNVALSPTAS